MVFPLAYHQGFNHGFSMAEAVNFGSKRWVEYGKRARGCLCLDSRSAVKIEMAPFVQMHQPELFKVIHLISVNLEGCITPRCLASRPPLPAGLVMPQPHVPLHVNLLLEHLIAPSIITLHFPLVILVVLKIVTLVIFVNFW